MRMAAPRLQAVRHFALAGTVKRHVKTRMKREGQLLGDVTGAPTVSRQEDIFDAQKALFGYRDPYSGANMDRKEERWVKRLEAHRVWYPPTLEEFKQSVRFDLKRQREKLREAEGSEEDLAAINELLAVFRWTPAQIQRRHRLTVLKRRGKGPPKKGQGKRK
ncbi:Hypothetical Protein FCC1311_071952 [Hondaea fermentalgiana]|uniref:Uncharacterized protein n=1 Tax=Hondaea fermentalgiana TaxID=2315210 RepID=A0A2R5GSW9_9STRA|nr:Hypothetical Protein FCC1311_071952 [Hondaea fermentalgiana]|eukprot:GBG30974.1 Hypothetical Protein FCC1311_071952 [Hondaea fermentalgiana]